MMEVDDCPALRLDGLPAELLLHIFQYLDVDFILCSVSKVPLHPIASSWLFCLQVCNLFNELASDEATWKVRVAKRFPGTQQSFFNPFFEIRLPLTRVILGQYPALPPPSNFCWAVACARREKEAWMWKMSSSIEKEEKEGRATITCPTAHYAAVRLRFFMTAKYCWPFTIILDSISNRRKSVNSWLLSSFLILQQNYHKNLQISKIIFLTTIVNTITITIIKDDAILPGGQCACDGEGGGEREQGPRHQCLVHPPGHHYSSSFASLPLIRSSSLSSS